MLDIFWKYFLKKIMLVEKSFYVTGLIRKAIMDYEQTALIYRNFGQEKKFQEKPDYNRYKKEQSFGVVKINQNLIGCVCYIS